MGNVAGRKNGVPVNPYTNSMTVTNALAGGTVGIGTNADTIFQRIAANRAGLYDGSTTAGTLRLGILEFSAAASTFSQSATITNGPRAANPVSWHEVTYNNGASTGRIAIW